MHVLSIFFNFFQAFEVEYYKMKLLIITFFCYYNVVATMDTEWWKHTVIYELMPQTFKDSNGDGIGDLKGIISKLDYFIDLGIETVYLTPCFKTSFQNMGYDIIDFYAIDPMFGTMDDFEDLTREMKARGLKLMLDLVINHSSDQHEWFQKSVNGIDPYTDYYMWEDPNYGYKNAKLPPNFWRGWYWGSAWTWNEKRKQYYYHLFSKHQPDLNLKNEHVKQEIKNIMKFWFDKGVAGFGMDAPLAYMEDPLLQNKGIHKKDGQLMLRESFQFIHELRLFVDDYNKKNGGIQRILAPETSPKFKPAIHLSGTEDYSVAHFPFNYNFRDMTSEILAADFNNLIQSWLSYIPNEIPPAWVSQNHDSHRQGSRIRYEYMDILTITKAVLNGIMHVYYGEEIGLLNGYVKTEQIKDTLEYGSKDPARLLMQWDDSLNAGFSTNEKPFTPPCMDYVTKNVKIQKSQPISHYNVFKDVVALRKTKTLKYGKLSTYVDSAYVYLFWRTYPEEPTVIVAINFDYRSAKVNLRKAVKDFSGVISVVTASINSGIQKGDEIIVEENYEFKMDPLTAVVFITEGDKFKLDSN